MGRDEILSWAHTWVESHQSNKDAADLAQQKLSDVITQSADVIEFTLDLEEALGMDDTGLDLEALTPKLATLTFAELADEIVTLLRSRKA